MSNIEAAKEFASKIEAFRNSIPNGLLEAWNNFAKELGILVEEPPNRSLVKDQDGDYWVRADEVGSFHGNWHCLTFSESGRSWDHLVKSYGPLTIVE